MKRVNVRIHNFDSDFVDQCDEDPFQNDELNVLYIGDNHYQALIPLEEYQQQMDMQESEADEDDEKLENEDEFARFQKNLLRDDNIVFEDDDEPEIDEKPLQDYDLNYIEDWIKNNIENYQFQSHQ